MRIPQIILAAATVAACANPGTPTGGPKDYRAPVLVSSVPELGGTGFDGRKVTLVFDENVQLTNADEVFVMSPPTNKKPTVRAHGREVTVTFDEDLQPSTTYTLDFADCLGDLNENNLLKGYTFSFSTGESQDSMMISGNIYDPLTITPIEGIYVLLHNNLTDTAVTNMAPVRIAKTNAEGRFAIKNVPAETDYHVFALDDQNRNFRYDQVGMEKVAFESKSIRPGWEIRQVADSVRTDSTVVEADSLRHIYRHVMRDTLTMTPDSLILFAFMEEKFDQYITSDERKERNKVRIIMHNKAERRPRISFVGQPGRAEDHALIHYTPTHDTITVWMTDTLIWKRDSVVLAIDYDILDSAQNLVSKIDTLTEWHFERPKKDDSKSKRRKTKENAPAKVPTLDVKTSAEVAPFGSFDFNTSTPYARFDWNAVHLYHKVDTTYVPITFSEIEDTVFICHKSLRHKWEPGGNYRVEVDSAAICDIYGLTSDKIKQDFRITSLDKYATLYIDVTNAPEHSIVQLVNSRGLAIRQNKLPASCKVGFRYVKPGDYMLRIIEDVNENGEWDSGSMAEHRLPERVIYYMEKVTARANWTIKIEFDASQFTPDKYVRKFGKDKNSKGKKKR